MPKTVDFYNISPKQPIRNSNGIAGNTNQSRFREIRIITSRIRRIPGRSQKINGRSDGTIEGFFVRNFFLVLDFL